METTKTELVVSTDLNPTTAREEFRQILLDMLIPEDQFHSWLRSTVNGFAVMGCYLHAPEDIQRLENHFEPDNVTVICQRPLNY